jgi:hypothetical protein
MVERATQSALPGDADNVAAGIDELALAVAFRPRRRGSVLEFRRLAIPEVVVVTAEA